MYQRCPGDRHVSPSFGPGHRSPRWPRWPPVTSLLAPLPSLLLLALRAWERLSKGCLRNVHLVVDCLLCFLPFLLISIYIFCCLSWPNPHMGLLSWRPPIPHVSIYLFPLYGSTHTRFFGHRSLYGILPGGRGVGAFGDLIVSFHFSFIHSIFRDSR